MCVDDSGRWGRGGLFSAISARSTVPQTAYEEAGHMRDLSLGDAHLVDIDDLISREQGKDMVKYHIKIACGCGKVWLGYDYSNGRQVVQRGLKIHGCVHPKHGELGGLRSSHTHIHTHTHTHTHTQACTHSR